MDHTDPLELMAEYATDTPYHPVQRVQFANPLGHEDHAVVLVLDNGYGTRPDDPPLDFFRSLWDQHSRKEL